MESIAEQNGDNEKIIQGLRSRIEEKDKLIETLKDQLSAQIGPGPRRCVAKYPGEPTFTLVGRDALSAGTIFEWIDLAKASGVSNEKIDDALSKLILFREWQNNNQDKVKLPD